MLLLWLDLDAGVRLAAASRNNLRRPNLRALHKFASVREGHLPGARRRAEGVAGRPDEHRGRDRLMFTRAGIDLRRARVILIYARVGVRGGRRVGYACLLRFRSGDLAWYCKRAEFLRWGIGVDFYNHQALWSCEWGQRSGPQSNVDCPDALAWRERQRAGRQEAIAA